jgi:uncharacterized protein YdhG (YjbR/CyaY superfamily)
MVMVYHINMRMNVSITTVDEYISLYPKKTQDILKKIRKIIKKLAPQATEKISYGIPTYVLNGNLVHFGAYPTHIGLYPGPEAILQLSDQLEAYRTSKGTVQFSLESPVPYELIEAIVAKRIEQALNN